MYDVRCTICILRTSRACLKGHCKCWFDKIRSIKNLLRVLVTSNREYTKSLAKSKKRERDCGKYENSTYKHFLQHCKYGCLCHCDLSHWYDGQKERIESTFKSVILIGIMNAQRHALHVRCLASVVPSNLFINKSPILVVQLIPLHSKSILIT